MTAVEIIREMKMNEELLERLINFLKRCAASPQDGVEHVDLLNKLRALRNG